MSVIAKSKLKKIIIKPENSGKEKEQENEEKKSETKTNKKGKQSKKKAKGTSNKISKANDEVCYHNVLIEKLKKILNVDLYL